MSMSVSERRVEVLREDQADWGKLRIVKASSKYDRRYRYLVVEWCPPEHVGTEWEEYSFQVMKNWWPAAKPEYRAEANGFFAGLRLSLSLHYMQRDAADAAGQ